MKNFPMPILKILPTAAPLSDCASTASIEASSTRHPVVAPAGTDLRVRLDRGLDIERSRPGDRFGAHPHAPTTLILPRRAIIEGHVPMARESNSTGQDVKLASNTNPAAEHADQVTNLRSRIISASAKSVTEFTFITVLGVTLREGIGRTIK
jgi:hypothetical protein